MKNCPKCNKEHEKPGTFCSRQCANSHIRTDDSKLKTSTSVKNSEKSKLAAIRSRVVYKTNICICGKSVYRHKTCSIECRKLVWSKKMSDRLSNPLFRQNYGRGKKSYLETSFEEWLISNNINEFETEVQFKNIENNKHYYVDFLFRNKNLIIELDGTQHKNTKELDSIRDNWFAKNGYCVIRITHEEYRKKLKLTEVLNKILS